MSSPEKRLLILVAVSVLLVTGLPYLFGYLSTPPDRQFMGVLLDVPDYGQYRSWSREFESASLIKNKLTPEPNEPIFFNLLWWTMGRLNKLTGYGFPFWHEFLRIFSGILFLGTLYKFLMLMLSDLRVRKLAFLLAVFASGLGWILVLMKYTVMGGSLYFPLDVYIAEPNSFLCIMAFPHFILANALIIIIFSLSFFSYKQKKARYSVIAGLVALILGLQHAYDLFIVYSVLVTFFFFVSVRDRRISWVLVKHIMYVGVISCWPGFYSVWLTRANPIWKEVLSQFSNAGVFTPDPFHLLILMGIPLILAILTFDGFSPLKKASDDVLFVKGWLLTGFLLLYIPTGFQVHMLNSWQIPVTILAAKGFYSHIMPAVSEYFDKKHLRHKDSLFRFLTVCVVVLSLLTNVYLFLWRFVDLGRHDYPYYLYRSEIAAFDWLANHTDREDIVLSSLTLGQYIPALSGNRAFLAHWAQTVHFYDKRDFVARFYSGDESDMNREKIIRRYGIDYVFYGPSERKLGSYDPSSSAWLKLVFSVPKVNLYRVNFSAKKNARQPVGLGQTIHKTRLFKTA